MQSQPVNFKKTKATSFQPAHDDSVVLCTLNARYIHASLGLRYLHANMGELHANTQILEFTINQRVVDIAEQLLSANPKIIGFGVYIWNIKETTELVSLIKNIKPAIKIIIGGPEVSYEYQDTRIFSLCDFLITGQADFKFKEVCVDILNQAATNSTTQLEKIHRAETPSVKELTLPYQLYNNDDIKNRVVYVEASRGCPFKCEFCLSALDKTAWPFELDKLLQELETLYIRGARQFKFVDRTFNLKISNCTTILQFFLDKLSTDINLFLHFEVIPDKLPDALKDQIKNFPPASLQFEVGIQSFNSSVQEIINRKQNIAATRENLQWLHQHSHAHIHADLIFGLPGETIESFADGFNQLVDLKPDEIQLGILKRLRGSPIIKHTEEFSMCYSDEAPYQLLQNRDVDFQTMQRVQRFSRYWDLIANSGRFKNTLPVLLGKTPFERFMKISDCLFDKTGQTHKISYNRLLMLVYDAAIENNLADEIALTTKLALDCKNNGDAHPPRWLKAHMPPDYHTTTKTKKSTPARQGRHLTH